MATEVGLTRPSAERLAYFLLKAVNEAAREFDMLRAGDRIAVAVSGGKDSLALLCLLQTHRLSFEKRYTLAAIHVRGDGRGVTPRHAALEEWLADNNKWKVGNLCPGASCQLSQQKTKD